MQFSSTLLEIVVGLICVFIALSLLASWINEMFAAMLNLRGKGLSAGIAQMVSDAQTHDALFGHPLIASSVTTKKFPSYISAGQFSTALLAVIGAAQTVSTNSAQAFADVQTAVAGLKPGPLKSSLSAILASAAGDYGAVVKGIQSWFNDTMNRVSGMYRRTASIWIFFIGLALVALLDADSIKVFKVLNCNSATRAALLASASAATKDSSSTLSQLSTSVFSSLSFGWFHSPTAATCAGSAEPSWQIPLGLIATTLAISLGAPFWFDALKFVMNVRNAGGNPSEPN